MQADSNILTKWLQSAFARPDLQRSHSAPALPPSDPPQKHATPTLALQQPTPETGSPISLLPATIDQPQPSPTFKPNQSSTPDVLRFTHTTASSNTMSSRPPASPDSYSSKKGFKQAFKRPFFARRGASSNSGSSKPPSLSLSSSQNAASRKSSTSTAYPEFDRSSPGDPAQSNTVRWKDHAAAASSGTREVDQNGAPRRSSSSHGSQDAGQQSQSTPIGAPANYFGSALGTPTPTLGASAPITSLHFVQTLNALLLEPTTLTICQLAPPSVLPIPWNDSPYSSSSVQGPSSTSLSTYVSQGSMSADHSSSAMCVSNQQTYGCNEQLAASALSLPSVSVAALWRASSCMQWINESADPFCRSIDQFEAGSYLDAKNPDLQSKANEEDPHSPPGWRPEKQSVFEIGGLLQNVMDVLSSSAAKQRVELVLYHGRDPMIEPSQANEFRPEGGLRELHCRGDDAGIATALMAVRLFLFDFSPLGDGSMLSCLLRVLLRHTDCLQDFAAEPAGRHDRSWPVPHLPCN